MTRTRENPCEGGTQGRLLKNHKRTVEHQSGIVALPQGGSQTDCYQHIAFVAAYRSAGVSVPTGAVRNGRPPETGQDVRIQ